MQTDVEYLFIGSVLFLAATTMVLLVMDSLECFLHTLRYKGKIQKSFLNFSFVAHKTDFFVIEDPHIVLKYDKIFFYNFVEGELCSHLLDKWW